MEIIGKILGMNTSDGLINLLVVNEANEQFNIKTTLSSDNFVIGDVYIFNTNKSIGERISYQLVEYQSLRSLEVSKSDKAYRDFFNSAPVSYYELKKCITGYINLIDNTTIRKITEALVNKYENKFYIYPAATRMHHAYVGGLAYHTMGMLTLAESFIKNYPYLDKNYLYAGIILHDIGKTIELTGIENTEYSLDGQLLGHLVIGAIEINKVSIELKLNQEKEVKILEHMLISHHGQPQFGAAKRPMTPEAIALWYIDTIDSKFRVLGEELEKTSSGSFTDTIGVLEKIKVYKE